MHRNDVLRPSPGAPLPAEMPRLKPGVHLGFKSYFEFPAASWVFLAGVGGIQGQWEAPTKRGATVQET